MSARWGLILDAVARAADHLHSAASATEAMPNVLEMLGRATGVCRVYVFERLHTTDLARVRQRFEWCEAGVEPQIDNPELQDTDLVAAGFARWVTELSSGRAIVGDVADFPADERPLLEGQSIVSVLVQPIFSGAHWWGFIGFDACAERRAWDHVEVDTLRVAARVCGMALALEARETHARHAYKMEALGRMAGGIAHDFNNLLMVMYGSLELLRRELREAGHDSSRHVVELDQAISQGTRLTRQLLAFSRPVDERAPLSEPLEVLRGVDALLRRVAGSKVMLDIDALGEIAPVRMASVQLEQIVLNLVVNARDAMPDGGVLQIRLRTLDASEALVFGDVLAPGEHTLLSVRDSGHGIPPELQERIFEPFFTTKAGHGTGLGLATVYGAVSAASGALRLSSSEAGTELRVYLPAERGDHTGARPQPASVSCPPDVEPSRGRGELVLVCDDNAASLEWIAHVLDEADYLPMTFTNGEACLAIEEVARQEIGVLLTDVRMHPMDGPTLAAELRARIPGLPTVFMSGFTANLIGGLEADDVLLDKPFTRPQLLCAIERALRRRVG